ncbi:peptide/nickel transport system substrate-binding protein [Pseudonocardia thermophila]|uniref:Peptide/nickel transport system substrate-binding protein n=1 Tax=Pseudonocardia thermophila TaxID=1848 RepID=A0A1M6XZ55_PSETH|nr:ABC transporter substrate-binding protein [Pseudonocardia thermophila]SHL11264.1 peptide/nickel transport system substrate-binding protein [Pseudonocardia thermophila]
MRRAALRWSAALAAAALVLTGCGGGGEEPAGAAGEYDPNAVFRYAVPGNPTSFDPRQSAPLDPVFLDVVYESLIERTPDGQLKPGLATGWSFSADNTVLDLELREGVTFHDGEKLDAAAAVASLEALRARGAQASALRTVEKVEATGPMSLRITFSEPSGYMINVLAGEAGIVVSPKAIDDPNLGTKPVGTGAFKLQSLEQGRVTFTRFDDYWNNEATTIAGIEMIAFSDEPTRLRAVVSGEVDGTTINAGQVREAKANGLTVVQGPNSTFNGMLLNTSRPELADPRVRKAIMHAIDRKAIADSLFDGGCTPTVQPFAEGFWPHVPEMSDVTPYYDPEKAKSLLAEAGHPNGISFDIVHGPNTTYQNLSQALQAQLREAGINVTVRPLEFTQMIEARRSGNFVATVALVQAGRPDPSQFVVDFYSPGGTYNPGGFSEPGIAELLSKSRASSDENERAAYTREIFQKVFDAGPPVIPVCAVQWVAAFRDGVTGFEVPRYGDYDFTKIKISR